MSSHAHLIKMEFWEMKYRLMAFLILAESKLKSWIIKYGRRDSVELLLDGYVVSRRDNLFLGPSGVYCTWFGPSLWLFHFVCVCVCASQSFIEGYKFFDQYEIIYKALKHAAEIYLKSDTLGKIILNDLYLMFVVNLLSNVYGFVPKF